MENLTFTIVALFILAFGAISGRIGRTILTPPILFVGFGFLLGVGGIGLVVLEAEHPLIHFIAELTLILVLFTDATRIDLKRLRGEHDLPVRLLGIGLPLTMVFGALAAKLIFPELDIWLAVILGVMLAPTDAALGQAVVSSPKVPVRIRQALNVESGLNDGIALPFLFFFLCLAMTVHGGHDDNFLLISLQQLTLGPLVGIGVGFFGGKLVAWGRRSEWMNESFANLSMLGMALLAFAGAELIGGNGFIAAFAAGLTLGNTERNICPSIYEFAEAEGQLLTLLTFLFYGAVMLPGAFGDFSPQVVIYALLSLTLVRFVPVWLALLGQKLKPATIGFLGWFGPRGVASILYGLLIMEEMALPNREFLFNVVLITVLFSVVLHGVTAWPGVNWYEKKARSAEEEGKTVSEMPLRHS